jgi:hypothetical protein
MVNLFRIEKEENWSKKDAIHGANLLRTVEAGSKKNPPPERGI